MALADEFGITLDSSRVPWRHALYDSEDEEDEHPNSKDLFYFDVVFQGKKFDAATLIVCVGTLASDFAVSHLLQRGTQPSYTLCTNIRSAVYPRYSEVPEKREVDKVVSSFYEQREDGNRVVVVHSKELKRGMEMAWAEKILEDLKPASVLVIDSSHHLHFISQSRPLVPFLRCAMTSTWKEAPPTKCPPLEAPNFIKGEAAALITLCEYQRVAAAAVVCFFGQSEYIESVKALRHIGRLLHLKQGELPSDGDIAKLVRSHPTEGNSPAANLYT